MKKRQNRSGIFEYEQLETRKLLASMSTLFQFSDDAGMYQIFSNFGKTGRVNLDNGTFDVASMSAGTKVNAAGFNVADNFAYGIYSQNYEVARIAPNGQTESLGPVTGLPKTGSYYVGDFADDGLLYVRGSSQQSILYGINVEEMSVDNQIETLTPLKNIYDIAFNTVDRKFYASQRGAENMLLSVDMNGEVEVIGKNGIGKLTFGAMYADADGNVFGGANQTGDVYRFDTVTGEATKVGVGPKSGVNDGFSNPQQVIEIPPLAQDDQLSFASTDGMIGNLFADSGNGADLDGNDDVFNVIKVDGQDISTADGIVKLESGATIRVAATGDFKYTPDDSVYDLTTEETMTDTFAYTIQDDSGRTSSANVEITVQGTKEVTPFSETTIRGLDAFGGKSSAIMTPVGDVNGDGFEDGLVSSSAAIGGKGVTVLVYGSENGFEDNFNINYLRSINGGDGSEGTIFYGVSSNDLSGHVITGLGDVNGDGIDDFAIAAKDADPGGVRNAGATYVIFGNTEGYTAEFRLEALLASSGGDGTLGFVLNGAVAHDLSATHVAALGDFNADGVDDFVVGSPHVDVAPDRKNAGQAYVIYGSSTGFDAEMELSNLASEDNDGQQGFAISGIKKHDLASSQISTGGDLNGDGFDDLVITAERADALGHVDAGQSYIIFGNNKNLSGMELSELVQSTDSSNGFVINGSSRFKLSGAFVEMAGDVDQDGMTDLKIGLRDVNADDVYVLLGTEQPKYAYEIAEFKPGTKVLLDNFDSAFENYDAREWDRYGYSITLHSSEGSRVTIWGDPHVITTVDDRTTWFDIPLGEYSVTLSDGTTISWDTVEADPSRYLEGPPLKWLSIDSSGEEFDLLVDLHDDQNLADLETGLSDGQVREFARALYGMRVI